MEMRATLDCVIAIVFTAVKCFMAEVTVDLFIMLQSAKFVRKERKNKGKFVLLFTQVGICYNFLTIILCSFWGKCYEPSYTNFHNELERFLNSSNLGLS